MSAVHAFVAGRGAVSISELAKWADRSVAHVYRAVGRGELNKFGTGKVTADSVIRWYESFESYRGGADEVATHTPHAAPVAASHAGLHHESGSGQVGRVTGAAFIGRSAR
jgi:hypothetical protein